jgi:thiol-disulfide isomerase/thioredoxin
MGTLLPWLFQLAALSAAAVPAPVPAPIELAQQRVEALEAESRLLQRRVTLDALVSFQLDPFLARSEPPLSAKGEPLLVHLWSVHCPPCVKEMPELTRLFERLRALSPIRVVLVSEDSLESLADYLRQHGASLPLAEYFAVGLASNLRTSLQNAPLPTTLLLDSHMVVRQAFVGPFMHRRSELYTAVARLCGNLSAPCRKPARADSD